MDLEKPIRIDSDVPLPAPTNKGVYSKFLPQLTRMKIGDSFFREGENSEDLTGLIRYAKRNSIHLKAYDVEADETDLTAGVRVYRVAQDSLPGRKPEVPDNGLTYWHLPPADPTTAYPRVKHLPPGETPSGEGWKQISPAQYDREIRFCPDHVDYWSFDESGVCWTEWKDSPYGNEHFTRGCDIISAEAFMKRVAGGNLIEDFHAHNGSPSTTHWRNASGSIALEFLPGKRPKEDGWVQITRAEYEAMRAKGSDGRAVVEKTSKTKSTGYWRLVNGTCVQADKSPGKKAVPITEDEYNTWLDDDI